jgi:hypothetical protein
MLREIGLRYDPDVSEEEISVFSSDETINIEELERSIEERNN